MRTSVAKKFFGTSGGIRMRSRDIKARAEELAEGYQEARDEEFNEQLRDFMAEDVCSEDDIQGFIDSFTFPDEDEWAFDAVQSELDDIGDQRMEEDRDRRMGL